MQRVVFFPQFLRYRLAGFKKGIHSRIEFSETPLPIVGRETLDHSFEIRAAGFRVGKTDNR